MSITNNKNIFASRCPAHELIVGLYNNNNDKNGDGTVQIFRRDCYCAVYAK